MKTWLAYGKTHLEITLPDHNVTVLHPKSIPGLADEGAALKYALQNPLGSAPLAGLVRPDQTVAIVFSDITRPQPRQPMLKAILAELSHVPCQNITLINGLGTHRANTPEELKDMLGEEILAKYRVVQHNAWDKEGLIYAGETPSGNKISVNADLMRADVKILTGFIEPHFFAGFSGGPKAVLPGVANVEAIMQNHGSKMLTQRNTTWGVTTGNPLYEDMLAAALLIQPDFLFNVTLNSDKQITGVFAGDLRKAHAAGCEFARHTALVAVERLYDIVITSNSGYPLDLNLYQAVKGMSAAAQVVKLDGAILIAAEGWDGIPNHGEYGHLLQMAESPQALLEMIRQPGFESQDQWQVQVQAQIQGKADVYVYSDYLDEETLRKAHLKKAHSIETTVQELIKRYGSQTSICVLPEGPMTIPYLA